MSEYKENSCQKPREKEGFQTKSQHVADQHGTIPAFDVHNCIRFFMSQVILTSDLFLQENRVKIVDYSLVIPILDLEKNPYIHSLLESVGRQTKLPVEVHLVVGDRRQGRAINFGVSQVQTPYFATVDDDTQIDDDELFAKILEEMKEDEGIGMAGAACEIPEWASAFQKRAMREIDRRSFPKQAENVDSDMVQHPCLMMEKEFFEKIGGEDEELIRGLDPVLRKKVRDHGKRVVVIKNTAVFHLLPDSWLKLWKMYYRNGLGSGFAQRQYPDKVLELSDGFDEGDFVEKRSTPFRAGRRLLHVLSALLTLRMIRFSTDLFYMLGVLKERIWPSYASITPGVSRIVSEERPGHPFRCTVHKVTLKNNP